MRILVGCEESGEVRDQFIMMGHYALSCDYLPSRTPGPHYQGNILDIINDGWDMMIAFPPCTHIAKSGACYFPRKKVDGSQQAAIDFFMMLVGAPIEKICIENPVGIMSTEYRKPDQIIEPYYFGDDARKATCLWLKNLPKLHYALQDNLFQKKTSVEPDIITMQSKKTGKVRTYSRWIYEAGNRPKYLRSQIKSKTFPGIARAMADQWG